MNRLYNISLYSELESSEFNSSYDSSYVYSNIPNLKVTSLELGELCKDSPLYGNTIDSCNEPWKINLEKLEIVLKTL